MKDLKLADILEVEGDYWEERMAKAEPPPLLVAILYRAIADFLEVPVPPSGRNPGHDRRRRRELDDYRASAFRWIFSNDDSELNFKTMCGACGCDPIAARERLLRIRLNGNDGENQELPKNSRFGQ
jgi:hypothetical protein